MKDKDTPLALVRFWEKAAKGCYEYLDKRKMRTIVLAL